MTRALNLLCPDGVPSMPEPTPIELILLIVAAAVISAFLIALSMPKLPKEEPKC